MEIADADGDGTPDLVLIQPEGLSGNRRAVDLYRGLGELRFESKPARSLIRVVGSLHFGDDWSGDGRADLLSLHREILRLFPGQASGGNWLSEQPLWAHRLQGPAREVVAEDGSVEEAMPSRRATFEAGLVIVRSRYPRGNDLLEIVAPARDLAVR